MEKIDLNITVDKETLEKATEIFEKLGLTIEEAISIYLTQVVAMRGIPFPLTLN